MIKIKLTDDIELRQEIIKKLKENDGFCPCALIKTQDTVCMCKDFRENVQSGPCHCGLYVKETI